MLVCNRCGKVIQDYELKTTSQCHGYTSLGQPLTETIDENCNCGGEFVEATQCEICGEWFDNDGFFGVCESCLCAEETVENALAIGSENKTSVNVNGFIASVIPEEKISQILEEWAKENLPQDTIHISRYCQEDLSYFSDWVKSKK